MPPAENATAAPAENPTFPTAENATFPTTENATTPTMQPTGNITANLLPFGTTFGDQVLEGVDDGATGPQQSDQSILFYGDSQDTIYVSEMHYVILSQ